MNSTPDAPAVDPRLLAAEPLARAALYEVTPEATVGAIVGHTVEDDGVVSLRFGNAMEGYPGWFWTVSLAVVEDAEPTVLEVELLPGEHALLAPEWVPWAVRLADYHAAQAAADEDSTESESDDDSADESERDEDADEFDDLDAADFDADGSPLLHSGDVDGVDIDELDADYAGEDSDEDDQDSDDEGESGDDDFDDDSDDDSGSEDDGSEGDSDDDSGSEDDGSEDDSDDDSDSEDDGSEDDSDDSDDDSDDADA